jgi:RNA polymerase primary sigma factor
MGPSRPRLACMGPAFQAPVGSGGLPLTRPNAAPRASARRVLARRVSVGMTQSGLVLTGARARRIIPTVAKYRIDTLGELARQMPFTPLDTRGAQVAAAEELLHDIDPLKAYPLDFVVFRITGYRPKSVGEDLLTGLALQHDLGLLIEQVSGTLDVLTTDLREPVLAIDDVTERFNVTSKTIQRWRRKGLPARRFIFPDGKRRVGFLLSSVERFFSGHQEQVVRGMDFSQLDDAGRDEILRRARRLAVMSGCCAQEISRRVARKLNRSPATVLHTIRKHDAERPGQAIFPLAAQAITDEERGRILRGYKRGLSLRSLAKRVCRTRSAVYRVVVDERLERVTQRKVKFIDDPLYHQDDAAAAVEAIASQEELSAAAWAKDVESSRVPRDLPPYLAALYRTPLLTPSRERALFLKFNFHKFQFVQARRDLEPQFARNADLNALEGHLRRAVAVKNQIVQANLRLVVSVARKHLRPALSLMELISDGNLTLMRAVEGFDPHRGYRFSTYATFALMKGFARSVPQMLSTKTRAAGGHDADRMLAAVPDHRLDDSRRQMFDREHVRDLLAQLDDRERAVLLAHYGITDGAVGGGGAAGAPSTYEQVGERLGLSKQRVRQIEQSAIAKLRAAAAT